MGRFARALVAAFAAPVAGVMVAILLAWPKDYTRELSIEVDPVRGAPGAITCVIEGIAAK